MANPRHEGKKRVFWVTTIADISAPTVAEIDAGTDITKFLPKDGVNQSGRFSKVDRSNLSSTFDGEGQGNYGIDMELTILRDDDTDDAWDLFTSHITTGHVVVMPFKGSGAVAASDVAEVYPAEASIAVPQGTTPNERQKATVNIASTDEPDLNAAVAV